jgi:hypothetical protein
MDDYGNALHFTDIVRGYRSLGIYGWYDGPGFQGLLGAIDFEEIA